MFAHLRRGFGMVFAQARAIWRLVPHDGVEVMTILGHTSAVRDVTPTNPDRRHNIHSSLAGRVENATRLTMTQGAVPYVHGPDPLVFGKGLPVAEHPGTDLLYAAKVWLFVCPFVDLWFMASVWEAGWGNGLTIEAVPSLLPPSTIDLQEMPHHEG
jgi:hypothetical protein